MTTTRPPRVPTRVDSGTDVPVEDRETSFAVWTRTTMFDGDTVDDTVDPVFLRGID